MEGIDIGRAHVSIGDISAHRGAVANPYRGSSLMGRERSEALGRFLRGLPTPGYTFWFSPACGGAKALDAPPAVNPVVIDFYWRADGSPTRK